MCVCVCVCMCVCVCVCGALRYAPGVYLAGVLRTRSLASVLRTRFNDLGRPTNKGQVFQTGAQGMQPIGRAWDVGSHCA